MPTPIKLYGFPLSGHAHRVRLFLSLLGLPCEVVTVNLVQGEHRQPAFLARNRFGQVPVLEDGDVTLADSNAILVYLARRYDDRHRWLPEDAVGQARVQRWLSAAAGPLAFGPAAARVSVLFRQPLDPKSHELATRLLSVMEAELGDRAYLAGDQPTLADVAMHTYVAHAPEGGVSLEAYPQVRAWLARVQALPGFLPMQASPLPAAA